jgi:hypothetical protein
MKFTVETSSKARIIILFLALGLLLLPAWAMAQETGVDGLTSEEIQHYGEMMYRDGLLPSGEPIKAYVTNDVPVDGTSFTCVSCHLRSGMGSIEGEVITPPTNGNTLYQERKPYIPGAEFVPYIHNYAVYIPERPAYTDETLATLIATGIDPTGRSVLKAMPRYDITDRDMEIMIAYLKTLSDAPAPGVTEDHIKFATVIVEGTDPVKVESMLIPLEYSVQRKNSLAEASKRNDRVARMAYNMLGTLHAVTFSLDKWILSGPPETWRAQLDKYYAENPVYALLGGISETTWEPVHRFCEDYQLPDLFPIVDYPVISDTDWYTQYPSRGIRQEGEAAARYLNSMAELIKDRKILQIVRDNRRGRTLAEGFRDIWTEAGHTLPTEILLPEGQEMNGLQLQRVIAEHRPEIMLYWDDDETVPSLAGLLGLKAAPGIVIASGTWLGDALGTVPEELRKTLYLTYPYRLPQDEVRFDVQTQKVLSGRRVKNYDSVILRKSFITQEVLGMALMEMRQEYYRDFLLDTIGMFEDLYLPLYERISFGPGQRYASKGCYIVQLGAGEKPQLEKRSEWLIH